MRKSWLIQELNAMISEEDEGLWDDYEEGNLAYIEDKKDFDIGWKLGYVDAISTILRNLEAE
jgi:hypothetical protein